MIVLNKNKYSISEAARILEVNRKTIYRAIEQGTIKATRLTFGGSYSISKSELDRHLNAKV